ncbi:hypothetical protein RBH29_16225 [Herbivorax sp. ANBcel31]|uniref:hypothetical protein n=1 Tax=Herbivorax sp. ANBcel31 TaxID=3069754 RepID=UPI0027B65D9D|nr:hypothetical protein [Herbivorax sp. ANBcel31]MDQ2087977.1 hypothetical protein [Herbivorax sp. ANBcel31]
MLKKYYLILIVGLVIVLTLTMGIKYREQKLLEAHISARINQDIFRIVSNAIIENNKIVEEILETGEVRIDQVDIWYRNLLFPVENISRIEDAVYKLKGYDLNIGVSHP